MLNIGYLRNNMIAKACYVRHYFIQSIQLIFESYTRTAKSY